MMPETIEIADWLPITNGYDKENGYYWKNYRSKHDDRLLKITKEDTFGNPLPTEYSAMGERFDNLHDVCIFLERQN